MSEVDRLSNSGLYPVLPFGDKRQSKEGSDGKNPSEKSAEAAKAAAEKKPHPETGRGPKSLIDEYA